jgi:hypothetical protein
MASHLTNQQRNDGGFGVFAAAFLAWAVLVAAAIVASAIAAISGEARLTLSDRLVRLETGLSAGLTLCLVGMLAAVSVWWSEVAAHAPWFLHATPAGGDGSPWSLAIIATVRLMLIAVTAGRDRHWREGRGVDGGGGTGS